jgi:hypothetical protein
MIHISDATRSTVLARGGKIPPAVEPDLGLWAAAEAKRRAQIEQEERRKLHSVPRSSSIELQRGYQLHNTRPWVEPPPPPRPVSRLEAARRDRLQKMARLVGNGDDAAHLKQQEIAEAVHARLHSGAIIVPGPELDLRGMKVDRLTDSVVAVLADTRGIRTWEPEQLRALFPSGKRSSRQSGRSRSRGRSRAQVFAMSTLTDVIGGVDISGIRRAWGTPYRTWTPVHYGSATRQQLQHLRLVVCSELLTLPRLSQNAQHVRMRTHRPSDRAITAARF